MLTVLLFIFCLALLWKFLLFVLFMLVALGLMVWVLNSQPFVFIAQKVDNWVANIRSQWQRRFQAA
ncbi:MAG: hypothetical protein IJM09_03990 [Neisseriaceae bacterium]|nr:hypothetical protein [Neisseriaceae bacterium]